MLSSVPSVTSKLTTFEFDSVKVKQHAKYTEVTGRLVQEFCPDMKLIALTVPQKMVAKIHPATVASQASWLTTLCKQHEHTHPFNGPLSGTTQVSRYQKGKTNMDFTQARDSGIRWAICKCAPRSRQTTTPPLSLLQAGCPSCHPTNSVRALRKQPVTNYRPV